MISSIFKKNFWLFFVLALSACIEGEKEKVEKSSKYQTNVETIQSIEQLVAKLNSSTLGGQQPLDSINLLNQKIVQHIKGIQNKADFQRVVSAYGNGEGNFKLSFSKDTLVGVFSWNTLLGGTSPKYKSVLLKINGKKTEHVLVPDDSVLYEGIQKSNVAGGSHVYLLYGKGKTSYTEYFYKLSAYSFLENGLTPKTLFPKNKNYLSSYYSLDNQTEESESKIQIFNDGREILIPEFWGQAVVYKSFVFEQNRYVEKTHTISKNKRFSDSDFQLEPSFGFLNGSEIPVSKGFQNETTTLLFEDGTKINIESKLEKDSTNVWVVNGTKDKKLIEFSGLLEINGKLNEYIFLTGNGVSEAWTLFICDLNSPDKPIQKEIAGALLQDGFLYYKEVLLGERMEKAPCSGEFGDQTGYFKINVLDYTLELPTKLTTNDIICGFVQ